MSDNKIISKEKMVCRKKTGNKGKKAQITMFVIFGLVLLIIFIILLSIRKDIGDKKPRLQTLINELETGRIKNHVTACIVETGDDALQKLGSNGGVIYDFEGGVNVFSQRVKGIDYFNYTYNNQLYYVAYGLRKNKLCENVSYKIPDYPYKNTALYQLNGIYDNSGCFYNSFSALYDGFFGEVVMRKLCYVARESSCEGFAKGRELGLTIQKQLEDYVATKVPRCVNFSAFTDKAEVNITVTGPPMVEANIHPSEIVFIVKYPLKITYEGQEPVTMIVDYETTLDARLGLIYNFLYNILSMDSKNHDFNLKNEFISSAYWRQGLDIKKIEDPLFNPCGSCFKPYYYDDILEIRDTKSFVNGAPYTFRVALNNRRPALDKFEPEYEYDLKTDSKVDIPISAYDPDDAGLSYYFLSQGPGSGWREDDAQLIYNVEQGKLEFNIYGSDYGLHEVAVLAVDDSGMFDYQWLWIKIKDTSSNAQPTEQCIMGCIYHACNHYTSGGQCDICTDPSDPMTCDLTQMNSNQNPYKDCTEWCTRSANQCWDACHASFGDYGTTCGKCVRPIMHSADPEKHPDCSGESEGACINRMPDCFWVKHNVSNNFVETCFNDTLLHTANPPAYIITS